MDACAARDGVVIVFQHQHAAAAADDKAVALRIVGPRGHGGAIVEAGGQRAHRIEHHAHGPVQFFAAASEHHILRAVPDQVCGRADAMRRGRTRGRQRIAQATDLERGRQRRGDRRTHRTRHHVRADLAHATVAQQIGGFHLPLAGPATGAGNQAGAQVADLLGIQSGIGDRIAHGQVGVGRGIAHEAFELAVDQAVQIQRHRTANLAAQAGVGVIGQCGDARAALAQGAGDGVQIIAQTGSDAHSGDDDATHQKFSVEVNMPTRRSLAV